MALFTGRGFGAAANAGFQSGFTGTLQLLLQQKSEELQRELEGARAKQQKDQFDQQMAAEQARSDRDFMFAEKRADKADINTELDRLIRKNELSQASSDRTAERLSEENYRGQQMDIEREKVGLEKTRIDEARRRMDAEDAPVDEALAARMKAFGIDVTGLKRSDINTYLSGLTTKENVEASKAGTEENRKRTKLAEDEQKLKLNTIKRETMTSLMSEFLKDEASLAKELSDVSQRSVEEQVQAAIKLQESALDETEKARYSEIIKSLTNPADRTELVQRSNELAADIVADKIINHPVYRKLIDSLDGGDQIREFIREKQALRPKAETKTVEIKESPEDIEDRRRMNEEKGIVSITVGDKSFDADVKQYVTPSITNAFSKGMNLGPIKKFLASSDGRIAMKRSFETLKKIGRGRGWADNFKDAMGNDAFRREIIGGALRSELVRRGGSW